MAVVYIKEKRQDGKILSRFESLFNVMKIEEEFDKTFYNISIKNRKAITRASKKVVKNLYENNINTVVLSDYLFQIKELKAELYSNNINILDGRKLFKFLTYDILEKVCKYRELDLRNRRNINTYK